MATPALPFVGLIHTCLHDAVDGTPRDEIRGPIRGWAHQKFATGDKSALKSKQQNLLSIIARFAWINAIARLRGDHRRSAFFQPDGKTPIAVPKVLGDEERAKAYRR